LVFRKKKGTEKEGEGTDGGRRGSKGKTENNWGVGHWGSSKSRNSNPRRVHERVKARG